MKKNVAVIFGGNSMEHDISIITAIQAIKNIDTTKYNVIMLYLKDGTFYTGEELKNLDTYRLKKYNQKVCFVSGSNVLYKLKKRPTKFATIDVALNCCHGGVGERGDISGLLECCNIPYTCGGVLPMSVCMDKGCFKTFLQGLNIPHIKGTTIDIRQFNSQDVTQLVDGLNFPLILKPANLGSSIGISVVLQKDGLKDALQSCFCLDSRVLVEEYVSDFKEINVAVMGYETPIISQLEQPIKKDKILTFDNKYKHSSKQGMAGLERHIPAKVSKKVEAQIKDMALKVYNSLDCKGVVRFDFIIDKCNNIYLNEANSIPGSLAYYLYKGLDISYKDILDMLLKDAIKVCNVRSKLISHYESGILSNLDINK